MKAIYFAALITFSSLTFATLPSHDVVMLKMATEKGTVCPANLENAELTFEYQFNFQRYEGQAFLRKIKSLDWDVTLNPIGLSDNYTFMSDMEPTTKIIDNQEILFSRIIFELDIDGTKKATLSIGEDNECIMNSL